MDFDITSPHNERVKRLARLRQRSHRDAEGVFIVEGERLFSRALQAGLVPREVYTDGSADVASPVAPVTVAPAVLDRVSYRKRSQGLIAVFEQFTTALHQLQLRSDALLVAAEAVEKPGNLGAILRTADAAGLDAVIEVSGATDRFNPNLIRSSTGALFSTPFTGAPIADLAAFCTSRSVTLAAADPGGEASLYDLDLTAATCILVGTEDSGLSDSAKRVADLRFAVPMLGTIDSLNVGTTVAIAVYEAVRQRRGR